MARLFDDGSSEYLEVSSTPVTAVPLTIAAWFYMDDAVTWANRTLVNVVDSGSANNWFNLYVRAGDSNVVRAGTRSSSGWQYAESTTTYSASTWHHACGVWAAADDRAAYLDGANKGTEATSITPAGIDSIDVARLGDSSPGNYFSGSLAEIAIWIAALIDAEVAALAAGASPLTIRPASLVAYWPLIRDEDQDIVGAYSLSANGTPTVEVHPPSVLGRAPLFVMGVPAAAGAAGNPWYAYAQQ